MKSAGLLSEEMFTRLVIDDEGRSCRDIPESACREEPRNFFSNVCALSLSKSADGLIDPKLVLSWLMTSLGAPAFLVGLLVPIREAGALLPQLFTAGAIRRLPKRKFAWAAGSFVQGMSAIGIGAATLLLPSGTTIWVIPIFLAILAIARSVCSVSYKDVLGKTVAKSRRGSATGLAGSLSAIVVILFALLLSMNVFERFNLIVAGLFIGGGFWIISAMVFVRLKEHAGAVDGGKSAIEEALSNISLLKSQRQLRIFIYARGLLTVTALAPPFMIAAAAQAEDQSIQRLGFLVLASATAALLSAYIWGRLADRSSRLVLAYSALVASMALLLAGFASHNNWMGGGFVLPILLFVLMISYQGVRLGRSTHLVDMATEDHRAAYTALSNTIIGIVLIGGSGLGILAHIIGITGILFTMGLFSFLGMLASLRLDEVQQSPVSA